MKAETQGNEVECPGCGRVLPETTGQHWEVTDGDPLGCGCAGCWSADGEHAEPVHDDECLQCARDEIEDLRARLARATECRSVEVGLADELAAIHDTIGRGLARRFSAAADEAQRALGAIVDRLRARDTDCGSADDGGES